MKLLFKAYFMMTVFLFLSTAEASGAGSLVINGGAEATTRKSAVLTLSAENPDIVSRMCISNSSYCKKWVRYSTTKRWSLIKGEGTKTVYVWFKDMAGNVSTPYSASIILDTAAPEDGTVTAEPEDGQITLHWSGFTDSTSSITGYKVVYSENQTPNSCSRGTEVPGYDRTSMEYVHSGLTNGTVYGYRICAIDSAGNMSSGAITGSTAGTTGQIPGEWWMPVPQTSWNIQFSGVLNTSYNVSMYDLDLFDTDMSVVDSLHARGLKVVCYISAGSYEDWRPDADRFPASVLGKNYPGWPGERFIDIRSSAVKQIMSDRMDLCRSKGFDGVDPDNIDVFETDSGFPLTYQDGIDYANWLAQQAHDRGLGIGQKNSPEITDDVQPNFDWAVTEDCYGEDPASPWCAQMQPYIDNNKAVFMIEYTDSISSSDFLSTACLWGGPSKRFSPILKKRSLDGFVMRCN